MKLNIKKRIFNLTFITLIIFTIIPQVIIYYDLPILSDYEFWLNIITLISSSLGFYINPTTKGLSD